MEYIICGKRFFKRRISYYLLTRIYRCQNSHNTADKLLRDIAWDAFKRKPTLTEDEETIRHSGSFSFAYAAETFFPVEYSVSINFKEGNGTSAEDENICFIDSHVLCVDSVLKNASGFELDNLKQKIAVAFIDEFRKPTECLPSDVPSMPLEVLDNAELVRADNDGTLKKTLQKAITFLGNTSAFMLTEQEVSDLVDVAYGKKELKEKFYLCGDYGTVSKVVLDILFNNSKFMELGEVANLLERLSSFHRAIDEYLSYFQKDTIDYHSFYEWLNSSINYLAENMSFSIEKVCDKIFYKWKLRELQPLEGVMLRPFEVSTLNLFISGDNPFLNDEGKGNGQ